MSATQTHALIQADLIIHPPPRRAEFFLHKALGMGALASILLRYELSVLMDNGGDGRDPVARVARAREAGGAELDALEALVLRARNV